jgi:siderophore synthetase component
VNIQALEAARAVEHLQPETWSSVNRLLVAKAIGEFAHELLIEPRLLVPEQRGGRYVLGTDDGGVAYQFSARVASLEHWVVGADSIRRLEQGVDTPVDALTFIGDLRQQLQIPAEVLPEYLEELSCTLHGAAYRRHRELYSAGRLAIADFQSVEAAMTEGHPIFVANGARIGFSAAEFAAYAPEAAAPIRLIWLAARRELATFSAVSDLSYARLMAGELDREVLAELHGALAERGFDPASYLLLPVHPWQWHNRLAQLFAQDLAQGDLVYLGEGRDQYRAQQSIRTLFNVSQPGRRYVKTALSIRNMGFTRGMPVSVARSGPAINDWVNQLVSSDPYLAARRFSVLREVAFACYPHRHYERVIARKSDPYKEMLAALWRENPLQRLREGERVITMAALLHRDRGGQALLPMLIRASGVSTEAWLVRYAKHYLLPLVHCFYEHHLTFTPHCENTLLILENHLPVGVMLKDITEDVGVLNPKQELPAAVRGLALRVPEEVMTLAIFTDIFDCVFRFLAQILEDHAEYPEARFWSVVAQAIRTYEDERPQLEQEFRRYDLFAPSFARNCLNRLQLRNNRMMVDLNAPDPVNSLQFAGTLANPIATFAAAEAHART